MIKKIYFQLNNELNYIKLIIILIIIGYFVLYSVENNYQYVYTTLPVLYLLYDYFINLNNKNNGDDKKFIIDYFEREYELKGKDLKKIKDMDEISLQRLYNKYKNINYIEPKYDLKAIVIITIVLLYIYHTTQSGRKLNIRDFKPAFKNDNSLTGPLWVIILISLIIISIIGDNF